MGIRAAYLALATFQLSWTAAAAVADGVSRGGALALAAHVEEFGSPHDQRAHQHDCMACRALRTEYTAPDRPVADLPESAPVGHLRSGPTIAQQANGSPGRARSPPPRIG